MSIPQSASPSLALDIVTISGVATLLPIIRVLLRSYAHKPIAAAIVGLNKKAKLGQAKKTDGDEPPSNGADVHDPSTNGKIGSVLESSAVGKCCESLWKLSLYTVFTIYELCVATQYPWFRDPSQLFDNWPGQLHPAPLRTLYHVAFGFSFACIYMHHFWETRRSDHYIMLTHHIITLGLVAGSYALNVLPVGCMVLLCHDCNDILLEVAKMCKYAGSDSAASVMFVLFTLLWFFTRLYLYPFVVIRACFLYLNPMFSSLPIVTVTGLYTLEVMLCMLVVIHVYWTWLILKVMYESVVNEINDVRED